MTWADVTREEWRAEISRRAAQWATQAHAGPGEATAQTFRARGEVAAQQWPAERIRAVMAQVDAEINGEGASR